uniref:40S ribosomal protein S21 n=1 Tax=Romanomermis culicivorax TaxID=13658 RepID=A0A915KIN9_ROMCU
MQNEAGDFVDMYIPRKCSASNRIISAKDHASIQLDFVDVDPLTGRMTGAVKRFAISGDIRRMGESDDCINRLVREADAAALNAASK